VTTTTNNTNTTTDTTAAAAAAYLWSDIDYTRRFSAAFLDPKILKPKNFCHLNVLLDSCSPLSAGVALLGLVLL
jgi:hypothetical protein